MGRERYACQSCGLTTTFAYLSGSVRVEHHCRRCGEMVVFERADYDPTPDAPAAAEVERTRAAGWRVNEDGNLVIGGDPDEPTPDAQEGDD